MDNMKAHASAMRINAGNPDFFCKVRILLFPRVEPTLNRRRITYITPPKVRVGRLAPCGSRIVDQRRELARHAIALGSGLLRLELRVRRIRRKDLVCLQQCLLLRGGRSAVRHRGDQLVERIEDLLGSGDFCRRR